MHRVGLALFFCGFTNVFKQSLKDKNHFFEIARGSALEFASIHDVFAVCDVIHVESSQLAKSDSKRIVSMRTRLIQRTESVSEGAIEYEYRGDFTRYLSKTS